MSSQVRMRVLLFSASAAVIAGTIVVAVTPMPSASFGWFAYAPLSDTVFTPPGVLAFSTTSAMGAAVLIIGLIALAFWAGLRVGSDRRRNGAR